MVVSSADLVRAAVCEVAGPPLGRRELLTPAQARDLARGFKLLASETRLRLVHALERAGELSVQQLAASVAMSPQAVSNQLRRLVDRNILGSRRAGNNVYYHIIDPCLPALLELGMCMTELSAPSPRRIREEVQEL